MSDTNYGTNWVAVAPDGKSIAGGGGVFLANPDLFKYEFDGDGDVRLWRLPPSVWPDSATNPPIKVTFMQDGRFFIADQATNDAAEFMHRLTALLKENPDREVSINSAQPLGIEPVQQLANLARQIGFTADNSMSDPTPWVKYLP